MFRSDRQRAIACQTLLASLGLDHLWTPEAPTEEAVNLAESNGGYLSSGERVIFLIAWEIWGLVGELRFVELLRLDKKRLRFVGELLCALAGGSHAVDGWILKNLEEA